MVKILPCLERSEYTSVGWRLMCRQRLPVTVDSGFAPPTIVAASEPQHQYANTAEILLSLVSTQSAPKSCVEQRALTRFL
jgi:hypothetical protein